MAGSRVLVVNGGSSSLKVATFRDGALEFTQTVEGKPGDAWDKVLESLPSPVAAIGHRVVHGGPSLLQPTRIDDEVLEELRRVTPFAPLHLPIALTLLESCARIFPGLPQVACFDTSFHRDLPEEARIFAIPRRYAEAGVRRYGFHGISFASLMRRLPPEEARGRVILAHLGNGCSLAAVREGRSMDTTMGFTPAGGIPMSRRSGDLDPGLVDYLARTEGMTAEGFNRLVNGESGLKGLSGTSSDIRDLLRDEGGDPRAALALAVFCRQIRKTIGAYAAVLGGLQTLVFAGGIGENAAPIRERVCGGLNFLGIQVDPAANAARAAVVSLPGAPVTVRIMHSDEESEIERSTREVLGL